MDRFKYAYQDLAAMVSVYLASPYGFADATRGFLHEIRARLRFAGHVVNDPWEMGEELMTSLREEARKLRGDERLQRLRETNRALGILNREALDQSEIVLACLDGPDVDSGTASEVGYAFARGKKIIGYRSDFRRAGENEGAEVNLQVQFWIEESGGRVTKSLEEVLELLKQRPPIPSSRR